MFKKICYLGATLAVILLTGCAAQQHGTSRPLSAAQSTYTTKTTPVSADKILITDSQDSWKTKNVLFSSFMNQNTTGTAAGLTAQYIDWDSVSGGDSIANKPTLFNPATPGAIGGTTPAAGTFTTVTASEILTSAADGARYAEIPNTVTLTSTATLGRLAWLTDRFWLANGTNWTTRYLLDSSFIGSAVQAYDADLDDLSDGSLSGSKVSASSSTAVGVSELAIASEINTGTDTGRSVTPDALAGSNLGTKEVAWTIKDSDAVTAVADGKQAFVVPASMTGMNLIDCTAAVSDLNSAASGSTTVVLRRVRGVTAADMTSTGVTVGYGEYSASDETVDTANDDIATGDHLYPDVNAVTSAAQKGLSFTCLFQLP